MSPCRHWTLPQTALHVDRLTRASSIQIRVSTSTLVSHLYFPSRLIKLYHMALLGTSWSGLGVRHCHVQRCSRVGPFRFSLETCSASSGDEVRVLATAREGCRWRFLAARAKCSTGVHRGPRFVKVREGRGLSVTVRGTCNSASNLLRVIWIIEDPFAKLPKRAWAPVFGQDGPTHARSYSYFCFPFYRWFVKATKNCRKMVKIWDQFS
jgi:hypothetical protein